MNDIIIAERQMMIVPCVKERRGNKKCEEEKKTDFHEKYRKRNNHLIKSNIVLCIMKHCFVEKS